MLNCTKFVSQKESINFFITNLLYVKHYIMSVFSHKKNPHNFCRSNPDTFDGESRSRIGRQQSGDTYTLEISFPAIKYVSND